MASKKIVEEIAEEVIEDVFEEDVEVVEEEVVIEETEVGQPEDSASDASVFIRAYPGDSYLMIAERVNPEGMSVKDFARMIMELNGNAPVRANSRIRIR